MLLLSYAAISRMGDSEVYDRFNTRIKFTDGDWYVRSTLSIVTVKHPRVVHAVRIERYGGVLIAECGKTFPANGTNAAFKSLEAEFGRDFPWRECSTCAKVVGHYDWQVR